MSEPEDRAFLTKGEYKALRPTKRELKLMTDKQRLDIYFYDPFYENLMIQDHFVEQLKQKIPWTITMDATCDPDGSNRHAAKWCSVDNSALFVKSDAEYLSVDDGFGTPTNADIGTLSMWFKRASVGGSNLRLFTHGSGGSVQIQAYFTSANKLVIGNGTEITITNTFTSPTAWQHLVVRVDTSQSTSSNRVRLYLDGSQISSFDAASYPSQNGNVFTSTGWRIASWSGSTTHTFGGRMAEVIYCDAQSLAPPAIAEDDGGTWKPIDPSSNTFGSNGFYLNFASSGSDLGDDASGNSNDFTNNNAATQSTDTPTS